MVNSFKAWAAYRFNKAEELIWIGATTAVITAGTAVVASEQITNPKAWAATIAMASIRAGIAAMLAFVAHVRRAQPGP